MDGDSHSDKNDIKAHRFHCYCETNIFNAKVNIFGATIYIVASLYASRELIDNIHLSVCIDHNDVGLVYCCTFQSPSNSAQ